MNPVAWREAKTRASSGAPVRWVIIFAGAIAAGFLLMNHLSGELNPDDVRKWLSQLVAVQFAIALIIATNTAATSMTKEKESGTIDLLLSTPLTSKYILWGKLRGLVSFAIPLLSVPVLALLVFALCDFGATGRTPIVWLEAAAELGLLMTVFTACACVIGLKISLSARKTVSAVMYSIGTVILLCAVSSGIGFALTGQVGGEFGAFLSPFTPFTAVICVIDPVYLFGGNAKEFLEAAGQTRFALFVGTVISAGIFAVIVWSAYLGLVRGFDMIMRKQSGL
jgi:ABC-type transport system involved in multi-copper enzyme maturation permease subunit